MKGREERLREGEKQTEREGREMILVKQDIGETEQE